MTGYIPQTITYRCWLRLSPAARQSHNCALDLVLSRPLTAGRAYRAGTLAGTRVT